MDGIVIFIVCYFSAALVLTAILSQSHLWVSKKWYLVIWWSWVLVTFAIMLLCVFLILNGLFVKGDWNFLWIFIAPVFLLPPLCSFIVAMSNCPLRKKQ